MGSAVHPLGRRRRRLVLWVSYWAGLFVLTHTPVVGGGRFHFDYADKLAHFVLYFVLTLVGSYYLGTRRPLSSATILLWSGIFAVYGMLDEWLQQFVGRSMTLSDWLADAGGIAVATVWLVWRSRRAKLSEQAGSGVTGA
jgi:hypothetical protein